MTKMTQDNVNKQLKRRDFLHSSNANTFNTNLNKNYCNNKQNNNNFVYLIILDWNDNLSHKFGCLIRILLNFGVKKLLLWSHKNILYQIQNFIFKNKFFISHSRIKEPNKKVYVELYEQIPLELSDLVVFEKLQSKNERILAIKGFAQS